MIRRAECQRANALRLPVLDHRYEHCQFSLESVPADVISLEIDDGRSIIAIETDLRGRLPQNLRVHRVSECALLSDARQLLGHHPSAPGNPPGACVLDIPANLAQVT